jgi:uncharacterized protein YcnI
MSARRLLAGLAAAAALLAGAAPASAHIQVRPAQAAPADPVLWTVLVPSEQPAGTREVELAIPRGVIPFSFEDTSGWTRSETKNPDGSLRSIRWRGRTRSDGLATFRFLASTPDAEGPIEWKAIQTYRDGEVVRWIGAQDSDNPASTTTITRDAARENAGGESSGGQDAGAAQEPQDGGETGDGGGTDWVARGLGIAALFVALAGAGFALRRG